MGAGGPGGPGDPLGPGGPEEPPRGPGREPQPPGRESFATEELYELKRGLFDLFHGLSRAQLASEMHVDASTLSRYVSSDKLVPRDTLDNIFKAVWALRPDTDPHELTDVRLRYANAERITNPGEYEARRLAARLNRLEVEHVELLTRHSFTHRRLSQVMARINDALESGGSATQEDEEEHEQLARRINYLEEEMRRTREQIAEILGSDWRRLISEHDVHGDPLAAPVVGDARRAAEVVLRVSEDAERVRLVTMIASELPVPIMLLDLGAELTERGLHSLVVVAADAAITSWPESRVAVLLGAVADAEIQPPEGDRWAQLDLSALRERLLAAVDCFDLSSLVRLLHALHSAGRAGAAVLVLERAAERPIDEVVQISADLQRYAGEYLERAVRRPVDEIADLVRKLREEERGAEVPRVLRAAASRLTDGAGELLCELFQKSGRVDDLRLLEGALRDQGVNLG